MKNEGHLGRCWLKGRKGDAANVVLSAVGYNFRLVLAWLRAFLRLILNALIQALGPPNQRSNRLVNDRLKRSSWPVSVSSSPTATRNGYITGFNPLALPSSEYDPAVIADAALEALERVWGEEDTDTKPTLQRVLTATLTALCELKLTLAEARLLFDPHDRSGIRA